MWGARNLYHDRNKRPQLSQETIEKLVEEESFARSISSFLSNIPFLTLGTLKMIEIRWSVGQKWIPNINDLANHYHSDLKNVASQYLYLRQTQPAVFPVGFLYGILFGLTHTIPPVINLYFTQIDEDENPQEVFDPVRPTTNFKIPIRYRIFSYLTSCLGSFFAMPLFKYHTYLLLNHLKNYSTTTLRKSTSLSLIQFAKSIGLRNFFLTGFDIIVVWVALEEMWKTWFLTKIHFGYWFLQILDYFCVKRTNLVHTLALVLEDFAFILVGLIVKLPFRTLFYRMADNPEAYKGIRSAIWSVLKEEGIRGFYKGFLPALLNQMIPLLCLEVGINVALNYYFGVPTRYKYSLL